MKQDEYIFPAILNSFIVYDVYYYIPSLVNLLFLIYLIIFIENLKDFCTDTKNSIFDNKLKVAYIL